MTNAVPQPNQPTLPETAAVISPRRLHRSQVTKSPDAFLTIGELSEQLGLGTHVLRFWEKNFPQIKPVKRAGARRYYRPADVELIKRIQLMLYRDGYTIRGVQAALAGNDAGAGQVTAEESGDYVKIPRENLEKLVAELVHLRALVDASSAE